MCGAMRDEQEEATARGARLAAVVFLLGLALPRRPTGDRNPRGGRRSCTRAGIAALVSSGDAASNGISHPPWAVLRREYRAGDCYPARGAAAAQVPGTNACAAVRAHADAVRAGGSGYAARSRLS